MRRGSQKLVRWSDAGVVPTPAGAPPPEPPAWAIESPGSLSPMQAGLSADEAQGPPAIGKWGDVWRDNQDENAATIRMRMSRRLAAL